jgi:hypothetical protein
MVADSVTNEALGRTQSHLRERAKGFGRRDQPLKVHHLTGRDRVQLRHLRMTRDQPPQPLVRGHCPSRESGRALPRCRW